MAAGRRARALMIGVLLALSFVLAGPAGAASREVELRGVEFAPKELTINLDDTVVWKHKGGGAHSVTADDGSFDSHPNCTLGGLVGCMNEGDDPYAVTFTKSKPLEGKDLSKDVLIPYHCKIHGEKGGNGMAGVIKVRASASPPPPPAPVTTQPEAPSTTATTKPKPASTTTTTRPLTTSSTVVRSTTTLADTTTTLTPNEPPVFDPGGDAGEEASGSNTDPSGTAGSDRGGDDGGAVAVIVALLLAVSAGGGYLLWRLRPNRSG